MQGTLLRFLELVQREVEADDVRIEIGGRVPEADHLVWCPLPNGWRLVALFGARPLEQAAIRQRLEQLAESFSGVIEQRGHENVSLPAEPMTHRLDDELESLALRAGAVGAVVIDDTSPVLWGTSAPRRGGGDVDTALLLAGWVLHARKHDLDLLALVQLDEATLAAELDKARLADADRQQVASHVDKLRQRGERSAAAWRRQLLLAEAIHSVRHAGDTEPAPGRLMVQGGGPGVLSRAFANIYRLVLAYEGPFSEIQADGALLHALPMIERLVLALPPVDPEPKARILRLPGS